MDAKQALSVMGQVATQYKAFKQLEEVIQWCAELDQHVKELQGQDAVLTKAISDKKVEIEKLQIDGASAAIGVFNDAEDRKKSIESEHKEFLIKVEKEKISALSAVKAELIPIQEEVKELKSVRDKLVNEIEDGRKVLLSMKSEIESLRSKFAVN